MTDTRNNNNKTKEEKVKERRPEYENVIVDLFVVIVDNLNNVEKYLTQNHRN